MRQPMIAGNWKMHGAKSQAKKLLDQIARLSGGLDKVELAVFSPFVYLQQCGDYLGKTTVRWGAQNLSEHSVGAYTGEVSGDMLSDFGCRYVIVGHSERRSLFSETSKQVAEKCKAAFSADIIPIICVGETLAERENELTLKVVQEQLAVALLLKDNCANFSQLVVAYEPVWAIGTGKSATPEQAQVVHAAIRQQLRDMDPALADQVRILYGGSVKPSNAQSLFEMPDIDGALVGGASLDAEQFLEIGRICNKLY